jgi:hypothetical protein
MLWRRRVRAASQTRAGLGYRPSASSAAHPPRSAATTHPCRAARRRGGGSCRDRRVRTGTASVPGTWPVPTAFRYGVSDADFELTTGNGQGHRAWVHRTSVRDIGPKGKRVTVSAPRCCVPADGRSWTSGAGRRLERAEGVGKVLWTTFLRNLRNSNASRRRRGGRTLPW